jgi:hypothetical protein
MICSLKDVRSLNVWGAGIADMAIAAYMPSVEVLSLSINYI